MNRVETALMNNPIRRSVQRTVEVALLRRMGGVLDGGWALEIGCGQGYGSELIVKVFGASHVFAVDIDPHMLRRARRRVATRHLPVALARASADALPVADASYDAVFDFGILHHVLDWRSAVAEVHRVLRPGGRFYFEEVTTHALARPSYRRFLTHPTTDRFSSEEFIAELERHGLRVGRRHGELVRGDFVLGVAERLPDGHGARRPHAAVRHQGDGPAVDHPGQSQPRGAGRRLDSPGPAGPFPAHPHPVDEV